MWNSLTLISQFSVQHSTVLLLVLLSGCGDPGGSYCEIKGSGFTASHDCRHQCLSRTALVCPDGEKLLPQVCSGTPGCLPGGCGPGEVCYTVSDPFETISYCVAETICASGGGQADGMASYTAVDLRAWEERTYKDAERVRDEQVLRDAQRKRAGHGVTGTPDP